MIAKCLERAQLPSRCQPAGRRRHHTQADSLLKSIDHLRSAGLPVSVKWAGNHCCCTRQGTAQHQRLPCWAKLQREAMIQSSLPALQVATHICTWGIACTPSDKMTRVNEREAMIQHSLAGLKHRYLHLGYRLHTITDVRPSLIISHMM